MASSYEAIMRRRVWPAVSFDEAVAHMQREPATLESRGATYFAGDGEVYRWRDGCLHSTRPKVLGSVPVRLPLEELRGMRWYYLPSFAELDAEEAARG